MRCEIDNRKLTTEDMILGFEQCRHCRASIALATFENNVYKEGDEDEEEYYEASDAGYVPMVEGLVTPLPTLDEIEAQDMFSSDEEEWM